MADMTMSGTDSALEQRLELAEFTVDPVTGTVSGPVARVQLDPKVMDVLIVLAHRAGNVVSRRELLDTVWPRTVVTDDALSRCIYQLRQNLSEASGNERDRKLLETLPKRGYRLNCEMPTAVSDSDREATDGFRPRERVGKIRFARSNVVILASIGGAIAFASAALWLSERARTPAVPTQSAQAYDAYSSGNEYFLRADRLIALPHAETLYRRATVLDPRFTLAWAGLARTHTDLYWHNIDHSDSRLNLAEQATHVALALSPNSPEPHIAYANYLFKGLGRFADALAELEVAEKSFPADPGLFFLRAMANRRLGDWERSIEALDRALEIDPKNILYLRQQHISYLFLRRYPQAERPLDRILNLSPDHGTSYVDKVVLALCRDGDTTLARRYASAPPSAFYDEGLAYTYTSWLAAIYDRAYDKAQRIVDDSAEDPILDGDLRNASFSPKALFYARTHQLAGNDELAREQYQSVASLLAEQQHDAAGFRPSIGQYLALAEVQAALGQRMQALESIRQARTLVPEPQDVMMDSAVQLASVIRVLIPAGLYEDALRELDDYLDRETGHWSIEGLVNDPRLDPVRDDPEFLDLVERHKRS